MRRKFCHALTHGLMRQVKLDSKIEVSSSCVKLTYGVRGKLLLGNYAT